MEEENLRKKLKVNFTQLFGTFLQEVNSQFIFLARFQDASNTVQELLDKVQVLEKTRSANYRQFKSCRELRVSLGCPCCTYYEWSIAPKFVGTSLWCSGFNLIVLPLLLSFGHTCIAHFFSKFRLSCLVGWFIVNLDSLLSLEREASHLLSFEVCWN